MEHFIEAAEKSIRDKNWYAALVLALTMPDICGKLEFPNDKSQIRFERWYNKYLLTAYQHGIGPSREIHTFLCASDCYALRCAFLHQGEFGIADQRAQKVLTHVQFIAPPDIGMLHGNQSDSFLQLQVDIFCRDVCDGVRKWLSDVSGSAQVQQRMAKLARIAPAPW